MNDITALAQRMKAAAEKAKHAGEAPVMDFYTRIDALNEFQLAACPANVLALVEALEKAQAQSSKWLEAYHKAVSVGARYEERIAELESRTVTVKLPDSFYPDGDIELPLVMNEYQVIEALVAAGCKPVAVCPRCKRELDLSVKHDGAHYCHSAAGIKVIEGEGQ